MEHIIRHSNPQGVSGETEEPAPLTLRPHTLNDVVRGLPVLDGCRSRHPAPFDVSHEPRIRLEIGDTPVPEAAHPLEEGRCVVTAGLSEQYIET